MEIVLDKDEVRYALECHLRLKGVDTAFDQIIIRIDDRLETESDFELVLRTK